MRRSILRLSAKLAALGIAVSLMACGSGGDDPNTLGGGGQGGPGNNGGGGGGGASGGPVEQPPAFVDPRVFDYGAAMRTASLKLVGELPTLADIKTLDGKAQADQKVVYEAYIDKILTADPRFSVRMIQWWRDTFRTGPMGGTPKQNAPSYDTAATFAAMVVVNDQPYTDLFTAKTNTCPTYANGTFTPANCPGNAPTAGVLTDPGIQSQFYANMAFRRVRFIQETFVCTKYPAELGGAQPMGAGLYTSPWDFNSITGKTTNPSAKIDFQDTTSIICANCHTTMNHMAPMFAFFDANGAYQTTIQVKTPSTGNPTSVIGDWLPTGKQTFAWRNGVGVYDIPMLGVAIAADPAVAHCAVDRIWNWALSRGDVVNDLATLPPAVTDSLVKDFTGNGMKMKRVIRNVFTSEDFTKF